METETQDPSATKQIFLNVPANLGLQDLQVDDFTKDFWAHLAELGVTAEEYQKMRGMKVLTAPRAQYLDGLRKAINQIRTVTPYLLLNELLFEGRTTANTKLEYRWEPQEEDGRKKKIETLFASFAGKSSLALDLVEHKIPALTTWQMEIVVSPVDVLIWLGIDPQIFLAEKPNQKELQRAIELYCKLARHLSEIPNLRLGDYYRDDCIAKDGAKPHEECLKGWLRLPTKQTEGGALTIRKMPFNPATWFQVDEQAYSIAPMHTPAIVNNLPEGNKVKQAAVADLIMVTTFLQTSPFVVNQIKADTCPRIDVAGTRLRRDRGWSTYCPRVGCYGSETWLDGYWSGVADGHYGSAVAAWE